MNFANLRRLTYHIQSTSLYLTPTEEVIALVEAFRAIAVTAKKFEMLHFAWNEEGLTTGQCRSSEQQEMILDEPKSGMRSCWKSGSFWMD